MLAAKDVRDLRERIQAKLDAISKEIGFSMKIGSGRYMENNVVFKLDCGKIGANGQADSTEAVDFRRLASYFGLKPEDLGREFTLRGKRYTIIGAKPRSRKSPILVKRSDGPVFKFDTYAVKIALGVASNAADTTLGHQAAKITKRPDSAILDALRGIECQLSPENLTMDGELRNPRIIKDRREALERQKHDLIAELGRTPTHTELYA
jgi:hypothetical protein